VAVAVAESRGESEFKLATVLLRTPSPVLSMKRKEIREKSPQNLDFKELTGKILKTKGRATMRRILLSRLSKTAKGRAPARTLHLQVSKGASVNSRKE